ncbi:MAG: patatin-like phospholipase family protein [Owenweeksia sp.]
MHRILVIIGLLFPGFYMNGQAIADSVEEESNQLRVGLVLSGGGAKCMAQIGALRIIEEAGIKIDYISGTSMGAIVGAMYALGYTVDEIENYLRQVDWDALLRNEIPRDRLSYFDRKSESRYVLTFPVNKGKVRLPTGLNYAQYILKELSMLTQSSYQYASFKDFPIPFACVATNLENGKLEVFEDGRLLDALRASSAFPSLFTPYELNGKMYVDGGVANNFPVELLLERGMDYIIGVDVQDFLYGKDELNSVVRILEQTSSFVNATEYTRQLDSVNLLIKPEIPEGGITSFDLFDTIVASGRHAALKKWPELKALAKLRGGQRIDRSEYDAVPLQNFYVGKVEICGNENSTTDYILSKLRIDDQEYCSLSRLDEGIDRLYGSKYFETVDYTLTPLDTGYQLNINVRENPSLSHLRIGLHYDDDFKTALLLNYTRRNLLFKNSRFSFDLAIGDNPRVWLNYFVDRGLLPTLGLKLRANRFETRLYQNRKPTNQLVYLDYSIDLFLQSTLYDAYAIGGGIQLEGIDLSQDLEALEEVDVNADYINYYGFIDFDSYNRANFPTRGFKISGMGRIISRHDNLSRFFEPSSVIDLSYSQVIPITPQLTLISRVFGATTIGPNPDFPYNIFLGSMGRNYINYIYPFVGYRYMELIGRNALVLKGDIHFEFFKDNYILLRGNVGKLESSFDDIFDSDVILDGYSLGYSYDSPFGPLEINVMGSTNHSDIYTYISLGFWF